MTAPHVHHTAEARTAAAIAQRTAPVIGWVDGDAVGRVLLDERLAVLRRGPRARVLPAPDSREGRQFVRWTAHVLFTEQLCVREAARPGLDTATMLELDPLSAVQLGSITSAAWRSHPAVGAVFTAVVNRTDTEPAVAPSERRWHLSIASGPIPEVAASVSLASIGWTTLDDIPTELATAARSARTGETVGPVAASGAWHVVRVDEVALTPPVQPISSLPSGVDLRAFARWLDLRRATNVRVAPGFEHPGDPGQPDNTHKH
jgi:[acyl-carrier-protein] S-malonyltransferase